MLQNQLEEFWSDSIPLHLLSHLLRSFLRFLSLLSPLLHFLRLPLPSATSPPDLDSSFLSSLGSGLASLVSLSDTLDSNRSLSLLFDPSRHGAFGPDCAVCMSQLRDGQEVRVLGCRHVYHRSCLDRCLFHQVSSCPLCKFPLLSPPPPAAAGDQLSARVGEGLLASFGPRPLVT
ncbi:hypothetical protein MLD38_011404 [Melastoma candidum]|uniref:Uncharacterized protein n=1 Tax=Melastoma candidum TaxID=119954 RepID=A0ACB9R4A7_9MYRT|nr:hypothetical protein MLD38_011404 [Melastoma candidum]